MSIPIPSDHFCVSADEPAVACSSSPASSSSSPTPSSPSPPTRPDGITLTVLAHEPHHQPWHLYGAALIDGTQEPDVAMPVIPIDAITHIHVW